MSVEFDLSQLTKLSADLGQVADGAGPLLIKAFQVTAGRVKADARESVSSGASSWKRLPSTIDYDLKGVSSVFGSVLEADIGYKVGGAGSLGGIREYGAPGKAAPHNDLANALHANESDFERGVQTAAAQAERRAGF